MLKWNQINRALLEPGKSKAFKYSNNQVECEVIAKKILGLKEGVELKDFKYEIFVYGLLSECCFAAQFQYDLEIVNEVLLAGGAKTAAETFENDAGKDDLLNLFDKEGDNIPNIAMLKEFLTKEMRIFQSLPGQNGFFWIAEWSGVNCWACYWIDGDRFNCLGKMSG
jgi:hypothetical protein